MRSSGSSPSLCWYLRWGGRSSFLLRVGSSRFHVVLTSTAGGDRSPSSTLAVSDTPLAGVRGTSSRPRKGRSLGLGWHGCGWSHSFFLWFSVGVERSLSEIFCLPRLSLFVLFGSFFGLCALGFLACCLFHSKSGIYEAKRKPRESTKVLFLGSWAQSQFALLTSPFWVFLHLFYVWFSGFWVVLTGGAMARFQMFVFSLRTCTCTHRTCVALSWGYLNIKLPFGNCIYHYIIQILSRMLFSHFIFQLQLTFNIILH